MADTSTIRLMSRFPTRKLAEDAAAYMPGGGASAWKAKEHDGRWWLEYRTDAHRAHRVLELLRADSRAMRFELIDRREIEL